MQNEVSIWKARSACFSNVLVRYIIKVCTCNVHAHEFNSCCDMILKHEKQVMVKSYLLNIFCNVTHVSDCSFPFWSSSNPSSIVILVLKTMKLKSYQRPQGVRSKRYEEKNTCCVFFHHCKQTLTTKRFISLKCFQLLASNIVSYLV